jgi:hypothetical protein
VLGVPHARPRDEGARSVLERRKKLVDKTVHQFHRVVREPQKVATLQCPRCGRQDCLENLVSCRAIVAQLIETTAGFQGTEPRYSSDLTIEQVISGAQAGPVEHPLCHEAIVDAGIRVGVALGEVVRLVEPELIVVAGRLAAAGDVLLDPIRARVERAAMRPSAVRVTGVPPKLIDQSEVQGAVALALALAELRQSEPLLEAASRQHPLGRSLPVTTREVWSSPADLGQRRLRPSRWRVKRVAASTRAGAVPRVNDTDPSTRRRPRRTSRSC